MNEFSKSILNEFEKIDCLEVVKHNNGSDYVNIKCLTSKHARRFNVIGDFNTSSGNMKLFSNRKWVSINKLGITSKDAIIKWVKKDIEVLTKG